MLKIDVGMCLKQNGYNQCVPRVETFVALTFTLTKDQQINASIGMSD